MLLNYSHLSKDERIDRGKFQRYRGNNLLLSCSEAALLRFLDRANTLDMLPQVPPLPPPGRLWLFFERRPKLTGSGSRGELSCSTDLRELVNKRLYNFQLDFDGRKD